MKRLTASVCFFSLAANLAAFELPSLDAAKVRDADGGPEIPAVSLSASREAENPSTFSDWENLRASFFRAEAPADLEGLIGEYSGYFHPLYEREDYTVEFKLTVYRDAATGAFMASFAPSAYGINEPVTLRLTQYGAEFADAWGGRLKLLIRKSGGKLFMRSSLYSDETYGVCAGAGNRAGAEDYTAAVK